MRKSLVEKVDDSALFLEIQKKREKMHYTADHYGLESSQTLSVSQELDKLINVYLKQKLERVNF